MSTPLHLRTSSGPREHDASSSTTTTTTTIASSTRVPTFGIPNSSASSSPTCPLLDSSSSPLHFCLHIGCGHPSPPASAVMASLPPSLPRDLWRPGSTSFPSSRDTIDPLESKRQLQKLYEDLSESSYDLSLRDIVDPSYSISGNLKAKANKDGLQCGSNQMFASSSSTSSSKEHKTKARPRRKASDHHGRDKYTVSGAPKCRLAFSFSVPGMHAFQSVSRGRPLCSRLGTSRQLPDKQEQIEKASFKRSPISHSCCPSKSKYSRDLKQRSFSASRVHPSNQCSSCSSYTIFFKSRCLVCGKLYCSNCAKDAMDMMSDGRKCKNDTCNVRPACRRFSNRVGKSCWPFCGNIEVQELQSKQTPSGG